MRPDAFDGIKAGKAIKDLLHNMEWRSKPGEWGVEQRCGYCGHRDGVHSDGCYVPYLHEVAEAMMATRLLAARCSLATGLRELAEIKAALAEAEECPSKP